MFCLTNLNPQLRFQAYNEIKQYIKNLFQKFQLFITNYLIHKNVLDNLLNDLNKSNKNFDLSRADYPNESNDNLILQKGSQVLLYFISYLIDTKIGMKVFPEDSYYNKNNEL